MRYCISLSVKIWTKEVKEVKSLFSHPSYSHDLQYSGCMFPTILFLTMTGSQLVWPRKQVSCYRLLPIDFDCSRLKDPKFKLAQRNPFQPFDYSELLYFDIRKWTTNDRGSYRGIIAVINRNPVKSTCFQRFTFTCILKILNFCTTRRIFGTEERRNLTLRNIITSDLVIMVNRG